MNLLKERSEPIANAIQKQVKKEVAQKLKVGIEMFDREENIALPNAPSAFNYAPQGDLRTIGNGKTCSTNRTQGCICTGKRPSGPLGK